MVQTIDNLSRRTFVKGAAAAGALAGIAALGGCASEQKTEDKSEAKTDAPESKYDNTISADTEDLNIVLLGKDSKIAAIILALKKGYYEEEKLNVATQTVSGGFPEAMPALSNGTADVLPFGSIPSCTYIGQGDDLVIFGGTVADGSECVTLIENKDAYKKPEDFKGKKYRLLPHGDRPHHRPRAGCVKTASRTARTWNSSCWKAPLPKLPQLKTARSTCAS